MRPMTGMPIDAHPAVNLLVYFPFLNLSTTKALSTLEGFGINQRLPQSNGHTPNSLMRLRTHLMLRLRPPKPIMKQKTSRARRLKYLYFLIHLGTRLKFLQS